MQSPSDGGSNNPAHAPPNDASGPSPQSQWPRWVHVVFFTFVVHLVMDLWYTCDALVDFDGLVNLFGWTWALIIIYCDGCDMGGWMRYICDICLYECICHDGMQKKNCRFGSLCRVLHSAKDPVAECHCHSTRQSWKMGAWKNHFSSFAECHDHGTQQRIFFKKNSNFAECRPHGTRQIIF